MKKAAITYFDVGPLPIFFGATNNLKAFKRELKRHKIDAESYGGLASTYTFVSETTGTLVIVTLNKKVSKRALRGVCAHEAHHVAHSAIAAMNDIGDASEETWAYIVQWATDCLYEELSKRN